MKKIISWLAALSLVFNTPAFATIINTLPYNLTNGSEADATQVMANYNQIVSNVNANAAHNGANSDITSLIGLTTPLAPAYGGTASFFGGTSTGSANAQVVATTTPSNFALTTFNIVWFTAGYTNTGPMTLAVNSTTATAIYQPSTGGPAALRGGEIQANALEEVVYDGTHYELVTPAANGGTILSSSPALGGVPFASTPAAGTNTTQLATAAFTHGGVLNNVQVFTSGGTYTPTSGTSYAVIFCQGGGGGGGGGGTSGSSGTAGNATSVGSICAAGGGSAGGGGTSSTGGTGALGGNAASGVGTIALGGSGGQGGGAESGAIGIAGGAGGPGIFGTGAGFSQAGSAGNGGSTNTGAGGGGGGSSGSAPGGGGGGGGGLSIAYVSSITGTYTVTIGAAAGGGSGGGTGAENGGPGGSGLVIIFEYK